MQFGYVKMWDVAKGFGFIVSDDEEDLFVHVSGLDITIKDKRLKPNQRVSFDVKTDFKGDKAVNVKVI
jgi:CspA family cold shock protein